MKTLAVTLKCCHSLALTHLRCKLEMEGATGSTMDCPGRLTRRYVEEDQSDRTWYDLTRVVYLYDPQDSGGCNGLDPDH